MVETGELVALKRIHVRSTAGVPDCVVREVKALQCCQHPNVVALRDVFPKVPCGDTRWGRDAIWVMECDRGCPQGVAMQ